MARTPRASVSATSGQGVSRYAYNKRYEMTRGAAPQVKGEGMTPTLNKGREYSKGDAKYPYKMHVSYGSTLAPSSLDDVKALAERKPSKRKK